VAASSTGALVFASAHPGHPATAANTKASTDFETALRTTAAHFKLHFKTELAANSPDNN
jgi:hypothetical protein